MSLDLLPVDILSCIFNYCTLIDRVELRRVSKQLHAAYIEIYPDLPLNDMLLALSEITTSAEYAKDTYRSVLQYQPITIPDLNYKIKILAQLEDVAHNTVNNKRRISKYIDRLIIGLLYYKGYQEKYIRTDRFRYTWGVRAMPDIMNAESVNDLLYKLLNAYLHELLTSELSDNNLCNIAKYIAMSSQISSYGYFIKALATNFKKDHIKTIISCIPSDIQVISKMLIMGYPSAHAFVANVYEHRSDMHYLEARQGIVQALMYLNPDVIRELAITPEVIVSNVCKHNKHLIRVYNGTFNGTLFNSVEINIMHNIVYDLLEKDSEDIYNNIIAQGVNIDREIELWCAGNYEYPTDMWPGFINYLRPDNY